MNRNRHHNRRSAVTIAYDVPKPISELNRGSNRNAGHSDRHLANRKRQQMPLVGRDTYASRTTASTSTTKEATATRNQTTQPNRTVTGKHHRDMHSEHHSSEGKTDHLNALLATTLV
jgi:hypothetical protein